MMQCKVSDIFGQNFCSTILLKYLSGGNIENIAICKTFHVFCTFSYQYYSNIDIIDRLDTKCPFTQQS